MSARRLSTARQKRTLQAGLPDASDAPDIPDTYGTRALDSFLENYQRVNIQEACDESKKAFDLQKLVVWANSAGKWERVAVPDRWRIEPRSICRAVVTKVFGLSAEQYEAMRDVLDDNRSTDRMGIYRRKDQPDAYAIVLRLPNRDKYENLKTKVGLTGAVTAGAALGVFGKSVNLRNRDRWFDAYKKTLFNVSRLHDLVSETSQKLPDLNLTNALQVVFEWEKNDFFDKKENKFNELVIRGREVLPQLTIAQAIQAGNLRQYGQLADYLSSDQNTLNSEIRQVAAETVNQAVTVNDENLM